MTKQRFDIEQRIQQYRLDLLYKNSYVAILTLLVVCTVYVLLIASQYSRQFLFGWYVILIAVLLGRWVLAQNYFRAKNRAFSHSFWLRVYRLGIVAASLSVGSLNLFFFPQESLTHQLLAILFPFGILAGTVTMLPDFFSFCLYSTALMMPVICQIALIGDRLHAGIAILIAILVIFFLNFSREYTKRFISTLRLRYENRALLEDIQEEKNTLNNRLGRIFNDSSNEIFIVDANNLNCLQVNKGAVENLGYSHDEFKGINLLDIFSDLEHYSFTEQLAPVQDGRQETVIHKGMNRRKDGTTYPVEARIQLSTKDVPPIIVVIAQDITERSEWEEKLIYQANFDQLTGLFNRHYMQSFMDLAFSRARRHRQKVALIFIDLDNFKDINDTLGHYTGDEVLKQTAVRLRNLLRESDTPARTGGDEFTILLEELEKNAHAEVVARKLVDMFKQPFMIKEQEVYSTVSIGISIYPDDGESLDQLMQHADMAMYQVKLDGRNNYRFFSHEMRHSSEEQLLVINQLRYALARDEFSLFFQPKVDIIRGRIIGAEALLRWHNPELGDVSPNIFIPLAEKMGFINEIGTWVLEEACRETMRWQELTNEKPQVSVNVSPQQFRAGTLLTDVDRALASSGLPCERLELEITENLLLQDSDTPMIILKTLNDKGIRLAMDDFGTGYSSLSYLRRFPLQVLKIDRSFISDLQENESNRGLVEAIIAMAQSLKLDIVAEGVENEEQLDFLRRRGVNIIQGYFFSPPVPAEKFRAMLQDESKIKGFEL